MIKYKSASVSVFDKLDMMRKIVPILSIFFVFIGGQNIYAQTTTADLTKLNVRALLAPTLSNLEFMQYTNAQLKYKIDRQVPVPVILEIGTALSSIPLNGDNNSPFEATGNYIYSHNIFEYEYRLQQQRRYPKNIPFYRPNDNSLFEIFD